MRQRLVNVLTLLSLFVFVAAGALWVRTAVMGRTDVIEWGGLGVYRRVELSGDDLKFYVLSDPGFGPTPFRWKRLRGGWAAPPPPSNSAALPAGSVTWLMPSPSHLANGQFITRDSGAPGSRWVAIASSHGGVPRLGVEYATFDGWYGPGTSLRSHRLSYFVVLVPAAILPLEWTARAAARRWRRGRFGPGQCRRCGYDLRATPDRCPECGATA